MFSNTLSRMRRVQFAAASVVLATLAAVIWLQAPVLPVLIGALGAGSVLLFRARRPAH
jgi:CBS-domain-containing membrane protein